MVVDDLSPSERFTAVLEWMIALGHRHSGTLDAGLVYVTLDPVDVRKLTYSAKDTADQLGVVSAVLRNAFRQSDLICRDGMNFWILAPFTQTEPVLAKVQTVIRTAPENGLSLAKSNFHVFMLRDFIQPGAREFTTAQDFLNALIPGVPADS